MSDDLVRQIKERRLHSMYPHHLDELCDESATALTEAQAETERLRERNEARLEVCRKAISLIREDKRQRMNAAADRAEIAASAGDMSAVSINSTESERYREAFSALNSAIDEFDKLFDDPATAELPRWHELVEVWKSRATTAESELSTLRARVREVVGLGLDVISEERGWGTYPRMEGSEIYTDADVFSRAARQLKEDLK